MFRFRVKSSIVLAFLFAAACFTPLRAAAVYSPTPTYSQEWEERGVGSFNAIGLMSGTFGLLNLPGLTSGNAAHWVESGNSHAAFATFDSTTELLFNVRMDTASGDFALFAWNNGVLVDSVSADTANSIGGFPGTPPSMGAFQRASMPVPEPEPYAMILVGFGVVALLARSRQ